MLTTDPTNRKQRPIARGVLDYFPLALAEIANVSYVANEQHNPGEPMHWAKGKSTDHADSLVRHLLERGKLDTDGLRHTAKVAWRALALLQIELEAAASGAAPDATWQGDGGEQPVVSASEAIDSVMESAQIGEHDDHTPTAAATQAYEQKARKLYGESLEQPFADEDTVEDGSNEHTQRFYVIDGGFDDPIAVAIVDSTTRTAHAMSYNGLIDWNYWSSWSDIEAWIGAGDWKEITQAEALGRLAPYFPGALKNWEKVDAAGYEWTGAYRAPRPDEHYAGQRSVDDLEGLVRVHCWGEWFGGPRYILRKKPVVNPTTLARWDEIDAAGYEWTGEFRTPRRGELFATASDNDPGRFTGGVLFCDSEDIESFFSGTPRYIVRPKK